MNLQIALTCFFILFAQTFANPPSYDQQATTAVVMPEDTKDGEADIGDESGRAPGTVIKTFTVTDSDQDDRIQIQINDFTTNDCVTVNQTQGPNVHVSVILRHTLDRDRGTSSIKLKLVISDKEGNEVPLEFSVYIQDVNDEKPQFQNEPYRFRISEDHQPGVVYRNISATDIDSGTNAYVTFSMKPDSQSNATAEEYKKTFTISNQTGEVSLLKTLDYEKNSYYQFIVTAQDMTPPYHQVTTILIIRVLDVQDTSPFFTAISYRTTIQENLLIGTTVMTVSATDGDPGVSNPVDFKIKNGDCSSYFNINSDGQIVTAKPIDRDVGDIKSVFGVCSFPVEAFEVSQHLQYGNTTAETNVTIIIEDVDDHAPNFVNDTFYASVYENTPSGFPITFDNPQSMIIEDLDQGKNANMHVSLTSSDFNITPSIVHGYGSLMITVANSSALDYENRRSIDFQVIVREDSNRNMCTTATVSVQLFDMNDNSPVFDSYNYLFNVNEGIGYGHTVGLIRATDADSGLSGMVTYSINGHVDKFTVDDKTGAIRTTGLLDAETTTEYHMLANARDVGGRIGSANITIHILDVNDNAPVFENDNYRVVMNDGDSKYNATPFVVVKAVDNDVTSPNNELEYSLRAFSESWMRKNMTIDNSTGAVFLKSPVNFELLENGTSVPGELRVVIEAKDQGTPSLYSRTELTLILQKSLVAPAPTVVSTTSSSQPYGASSSTTTMSTHKSNIMTTQNFPSNSMSTKFPPSVANNNCGILETLKIKKMQLEIELLRTQIRKLNA